MSEPSALHNRRVRFLNALRQSHVRGSLAHVQGWLRGNGDRPTAFLPCEHQAAVAWSSEHEALHEEPSKSHFIDVFTRRCCLRLLENALEPGAVFCDFGCSTGYLLEDVLARFPGIAVAGTDLVVDGLEKCHARLPEAMLFQADLLDLPFGDASLDAFASINVLEHVKDDLGALRELHRVLRPGGVGVLVVPAGPHLYDCYDEILLHFRRYSLGEVMRKARKAGFRVVQATALGWTLYPVFAATKTWSRWRFSHRSPSEKLARVSGQIRRTKDSRLGHILLGFEDFFVGRLTVPLGIRHIMLVERGPMS